jgi:hypothetical protein
MLSLRPCMRLTQNCAGLELQLSVVVDGGHPPQINHRLDATVRDSATRSSQNPSGPGFMKLSLTEYGTQLQTSKIQIRFRC